MAVSLKEKIEKNMTRETIEIFLARQMTFSLSFYFLPAKDGEVSYVVEMNVFMIGIYF